MPVDHVTELHILDWIGQVEAGEDLDDLWTHYGTVHTVALAILRRRRASLGPDSFTLPGDYSESDGGRRAAWLDSQIRALEDLTGDWRGAVTVGSITRIQPHR